MSVPSAAELLGAWELGCSQSPVGRGLTLLGMACPDTAADTLARLPVGRRDGLLLALRRRMFGSRLTGLSDCPACGETLQLGLAVEDLEVEGEAGMASGFECHLDGFELRFRLPDSLDLFAAGVEDTEGARHLLLERCLLAASRDGREHDAAELPASVTDRVVHAMGEVDPQADVQVAVSCPACGEGWQASFDIVAFLWSELAAWAERTLREVHTLASTYGWSEADLLAMHPQRRHRYLELIGS